MGAACPAKVLRSRGVSSELEDSGRPARARTKTKVDASLCFERLTQTPRRLTSKMLKRHIQNHASMSSIMHGYVYANTTVVNSVSTKNLHVYSLISAQASLPINNSYYLKCLANETESSKASHRIRRTYTIRRCCLRKTLRKCLMRVDHTTQATPPKIKWFQS